MSQKRVDKITNVATVPLAMQDNDSSVIFNMILIAKKFVMFIINTVCDISFLIIYFITLPFIRIQKRKKKIGGFKPRLAWGPTPMINYKYWSNALRKEKYISSTIVDQHYIIHKRSDFDIYYEDIIPKIFKCFNMFFSNLPSLSSWIVFLHAIRNYEIQHYSFTGGFLNKSLFYNYEAELIHLAKCKICIIPYGSDALRYSRLNEPSVKAALLMDYPILAMKEVEIEKRVSYWTKKADAVILARMFTEGFGRTDAIPFNMLSIDITIWNPKIFYSRNNGMNGPVSVIHTPNHKNCKGTEFLIAAVKELQSEGLCIELILLERIPNDKVMTIMRTKADILAEQFIIIGYALSGIEGMASGLPVLANLDNEYYTRIFRRYSYLNECPIFSTTPETLKDNLRILITNPSLREELGRAGRKYVEKYHSDETAQYIFKSIYDKIWYGKEVDLMNLFHPLKSDYNKRTPLVQHPLAENHLPDSYFKTKK